ncbi:hypothetical protein [Streptomyces erythrochromogenes]|uniref:hypothetical protein n=1 Tax=Streptomyces erythrochromogenes TaxID=285574 RepID=UPI0036896530
MHDPKEPAPGSAQALAEAAQVIAWLKDRGEIEQTMQGSLGELPTDHEIKLARMGDVLQATALGLTPPAAAVWAGVPEPVLCSWINQDPAFASALSDAAALSFKHRPRSKELGTPAMLRVLLIAMSNGVTKVEALGIAGFPHNRFRLRVRNSSWLKTLLEAARRVRPPRSGIGFVPQSYRPRQPGRRPPLPFKFRLVQREGSDFPEPGTSA